MEEEPRRGVSTGPALVPARQGMAEPARSSSGSGECLGVETYSSRELKQTKNPGTPSSTRV